MQSLLNFRIHPVGKKIINYVLLLLIGVNGAIISLLSLNLFISILIIIPSIVFFTLVVRFFRYPNRVPSLVSDKEVLSPADGVVVVIEEVENDRFYENKAIQISIFMSPYNVHLNWVPISGSLTKMEYVNGEYLLAKNPKASMLNEMACYVIDNEQNHRVVVKQIAGYVARRILPFLKTGDKVTQGQELGFIRFGSRVDVLLPLGSEIHVALGTKTVGLHTHLASLPK